MVRTIEYFLALVICAQGCRMAPQADTVPPPSSTKEEVAIVEPEFFGDFTSKWFNETTQEDDPYPSVCSLYLEDGHIVGSGILIRPDVVLTAGHCIKDDDIVSVGFGESEEEIAVIKIVVHPYYSESSGRVRNDIGLIFLEHESQYEPATMGCVEWMERYQDITTVGYSFGYKKYSKLGVFRYFGTVVEEPNYMKFIPRPISVWFGDSGGGVFAEFEEGEKYLVGVISSFVIIKVYGDREVVTECSAVIVAKYIDWIKMEILIKNDAIEQIVEIDKDGRKC